MDEIGKIRKKWEKKPKEWAELLNCSLSTVHHNGEEWCKQQLKLLQAPTKEVKKALQMQKQIEKAEKDHAASLSIQETITPEESQKQRIYKNTMAILDKCLIFLEAASELSAEQARLVNAQLKAVEIVVRLST